MLSAPYLKAIFGGAFVKRYWPPNYPIITSLVLL